MTCRCTPDRPCPSLNMLHVEQYGTCYFRKDGNIWLKDRFHDAPLPL